MIILDEIQEGPSPITALKYFQENAPEYPIAAGSLLGVTTQSKVLFPVGKVQFLDLRPLNFMEFMAGIGEQSLRDLIISEDWPLYALSGLFIQSKE